MRPLALVLLSIACSRSLAVQPHARLAHLALRTSSSLEASCSLSESGASVDPSPTARACGGASSRKATSSRSLGERFAVEEVSSQSAALDIHRQLPLLRDSPQRGPRRYRAVRPREGRRGRSRSRGRRRAWRPPAARQRLPWPPWPAPPPCGVLPALRRPCPHARPPLRSRPPSHSTHLHRRHVASVRYGWGWAVTSARCAAVALCLRSLTTA